MDSLLIEDETDFKFYQSMLNDLKIELDSNSRILDFGCGSGGVVYHFRKRGLRAFGVDIRSDYLDVEQLCKKEDLIDGQENIFRYLDISNYRIPFEDNTFDFILSNHVFEHVQNFEEAIGELYRVLKPTGSSLHFFPSKYRPIEAHVNVPFSGVFQEYPYLLFWAFLGLRAEFHKGLSFQEVARVNAEYLQKGTNYPSPVQVKKYFTKYFQDLEYREDIYIKNSTGRIRHIHFITKAFPFIRFLVRNFHEQVIWAKKTSD